LWVVLLSRKLVRHASSNSCLEQTEASRKLKGVLKYRNLSFLVLLIDSEWTLWHFLQFVFCYFTVSMEMHTWKTW